ncbi:isocitrate lyase/phosphoenolpyruvate mutase family protein [Tessaracoccus sp. ZS01]|uniref:isocitrate lyase/PEP mutase family protein n=1 Tax=Tessaracoccus sp. ZS01 TaxID=1906324 RepID=UPI00096EAB98|nr:isocitrate lyase/phosphoenolpyruvate mutase family protein [Tessaracoccus sp. ZS01]MCG6566840.1 isocitrate lyase/phosphoenolpyruvate mutase family protein [Tessaracoccus sp. ZS01]OMG57979.1 phosphonomutase [Tessaracoccus sp. ZS01]
MPDVTVLAQQLADAHESGRTLVLPTVWDTWSARVAVDAGFEALTVGSHPVSDAIGSADGEQMAFAEYLAVVKRIVDKVDVPVSADVESGYGLDPAELITRLLEVGAVGANIEDVVHSEGKRLRDRQEHADYIAAARAAADEAGVAFVINGRTDAAKLGDRFEDPIEEAVERVRLLEQAGARAVYPVGLTTADQVTRLVRAVRVPVNVTAHPVKGHGAGDLAALTRLGVRRVTFGPLWQLSLAEQSAATLANWRA